MGRRYQAILKHLNVPFDGYDVNDSQPKWDSYDNFIIATPTNTHFRLIKDLAQYKKPILCEKPLAIDESDFLEILKIKSPVSMMMQYRYFERYYHSGDSIYNYYNHGKDGLVWDCFQIIALARGHVSVSESSPIWQCTLNGHDLDLRKMDNAYIWAVREFFNGDYISKDELLEYQNKVRDYDKLQDSFYPRTSQEHVSQISG